ncbi:MAG: hypothetical protein WBG92_03680, partial [Thiohalocapsa sp.]
MSPKSPTGRTSAPADGPKPVPGPDRSPVTTPIASLGLRRGAAYRARSESRSTWCDQSLLQQAVAVGELRPLDLHLAGWLADTAGGSEPSQWLATALLSHRTGAGDVCLDLAGIADAAPFETVPALRTPPLAQW